MARVDVFVRGVTPALEAAVERIEPGATLVAVTPLAPDGDTTDRTAKASGYGVPLRLSVRLPGGKTRTLVFHTATANPFGHDRRADRAAEMLLSFDTFNDIPRHARALDVGAIRLGGGLTSLHDAGEFYLLTEYAEGRVYAEELRRVAQAGALSPLDVAHSRALVDYLADLHREPRGDHLVYRRSVRDLVGSGEGIAGIVDGYPDDVPGAPLSRLLAIEARCLSRRAGARRLEGRCRRIHGDFHPFNVVFGDEPTPLLLDASRGSAGDPADDVTCMAINYVFFAVEHPEAWRGAFSSLWHAFWERYLEATGDDVLLEVVAPYLAWRGLVVANPAWYPAVGERARSSVLDFVESALAAPRFDPRLAEELFA